MKLIKLIIHGFGPYAERQELDFEKNLKDKNMFVITGNTGAGKTTIFDAINFVLYGEASGKERDGKSLRSDFADAVTPTEVELYFSLRDKEYYIKRTPTYFRQKQRGEGLAENKATAELRISKNKTITGAKEVTKEIEGILGITSEQFKQLVMIPQGEFKRLLNAKSDEKEDIFRKIFGTEAFERIQRNIKKQADNLEKGIRQVERDRLNKIRNFQCSEENKSLSPLISMERPNIELLMNLFREAINEDDFKQKDIIDKINKIEESLLQLLNEHVQGKTNNDKLDALSKHKEELEIFKGKIIEFEEKRFQLDKGRKAITAKVYEDKYNEKKVKLDKLKTMLIAIDGNIEKFKESLAIAEEKFVIEKNKEEEKNRIKINIDNNNNLMEKASEYEKSLNSVRLSEKKVKDIKNDIKNINNELLRNGESTEALNKEFDGIKKAKEEKSELEINKVNCINRKEKIFSLISSILDLKNKSEEHGKLAKTFEVVERKFIDAQDRNRLLEDTYRKCQAGILAAALITGLPCPVCGSEVHPSPANLENSEITEATVKESKTFLEKARKQKDEMLTDLTKIFTSIKNIGDNSIKPLVKELLDINDIEDIYKINQSAQALNNENEIFLQRLTKKIKVLNDIVISEKEKLIEREIIEGKNKTLRLELEKQNSLLILEEGNLRATINTLEMIKNEFKGEIKTVIELKNLNENLGIKLKALAQAYENAEKNYNDVKGLLDNEGGNLKTTLEMKEQAEVEYCEAVKVFKEKVLSLGFEGYVQYKECYIPEDKLEELDVEVNTFLQKLAGAEKLYNTSLEETKNLSRVDIVALADKLNTLNDTKKELNNKSKEVFSRIKSNSTIFNDCVKCNKEIEKDENQYKTLKRLSNIINGEGENTKKISFERYVLASYFEEIIDSANLRFNRMTSSRFELLRKQEAGDMRKGQGLDLEVFDNYTGKARDVKTLSGGESFKASLAMALGLADVVQAYAGGIQLDTMFIDEGFGTLDPESLDNAIECLMDLQNDGRLVGIISHVPELKERITARLEVSLTNKGSKAEFKI